MFQENRPEIFQHLSLVPCSGNESLQCEKSLRENPDYWSHSCWNPSLHPNPNCSPPQSSTSQCLAPLFTQMQRPKPAHPPLFSQPPVQSINNPDSSNSQLHFKSDSLHKSHTYHYRPKAPTVSIWTTVYLLSGLSASTPVLAFHYPEKLENIFKWHVIQIMPFLSSESYFGISSHQNPQYGTVADEALHHLTACAPSPILL